MGGSVSRSCCSFEALLTIWSSKHLDTQNRNARHWRRRRLRRLQCSARLPGRAGGYHHRLRRLPLTAAPLLVSAPRGHPAPGPALLHGWIHQPLGPQGHGQGLPPRPHAGHGLLPRPRDELHPRVPISVPNKLTGGETIFKPRWVWSPATNEWVWLSDAGVGRIVNGRLSTRAELGTC